MVSTSSVKHDGESQNIWKRQWNKVEDSMSIWSQSKRKTETDQWWAWRQTAIVKHQPTETDKGGSRHLIWGFFILQL